MLLKSLYNFNTPEEEQSLLIDTTQFILNLKESILYRMSNVTYEDSEYFKLENQLKSLLEMGSVDFTSWKMKIPMHQNLLLKMRM